MTCTVISTPTGMLPLALLMLPPTRRIFGGERAYFLYRVSDRDDDFSFIDPADGELLIEGRSFDDEPSARAWVSADIALRDAQTQRVQ